MTVQDRQNLHRLVTLLGMALIIGGLITRKYGAVVIGLIVAAVNWRQARSNPRV